MLACSFDAVGRRISQRGAHVCAFGAEADAGAIADSVSLAIYADLPPGQMFWSIKTQRLVDQVYSRNLLWAPDGDEAFDDGSCILQFDVQDRSRVIAFKRDSAHLHDPQTLQDVWLKQDDFYGTLQKWHQQFEDEWKQLTAGLQAGPSSQTTLL